MEQRDIENETIEIFRRDTMEKEVFQITDVGNKVIELLDKIQKNLYDKADTFRRRKYFLLKYI